MSSPVKIFVLSIRIPNLVKHCLCPHALTRTEVSNVDSVVVNRITQLDIHHGGPSLGVCVKLPNLVSEMQWYHCNETSYECVVDIYIMFMLFHVQKNVCLYQPCKKCLRM